MVEYRSPLLLLPGAVSAEGRDAGTAWHYGDPLREQRIAEAGAGLLDLSHRDVITVAGPDRLGWLHAICSQHVESLRDGESTEALVLSMNGHLEQHWVLTEKNGTVWIDTEPGGGDEALAYLLKMRFMKQVEPTVVTADRAVLALVGPQAASVLEAAGVGSDHDVLVRTTERGIDLIVARTTLESAAGRLIAAGAAPIGTWAAAALRVPARDARIGMDTDHRTLPHEARLIPRAVHLDKGCYRGQETVARVQNLGKPPRRLVMLHLGGESDVLPEPGEPVLREGKPVGIIGTAVHHYELGPVALALVKRTVGPADQLTVAGGSAMIDRADDLGSEAVEGFAGRRKDS